MARHRTGGGDPELLAEVKQLNQHMRAMAAGQRTARPINVTQAPGEDGEALAKRVVGRMVHAGL